MIIRLARLAFVALSLLSVFPAMATDRYFPDITANSPSGRYRLDAKSPDNQRPEGPQRAFAKNFTYTLTDVNDQRVLWRHQQTAEASPVSSWVHDSGWVVVRTGWDEMLAFDPDTGLMTGNVRILEQFPNNEHAKYVQMSTAGPMWSQSSRWSFLEVDHKLCFVVRAHWGRRVIMDLKTGKVIADKGDLGVMTAGQDREWVLATLKKHSPVPADPRIENVRDIMSAVDIAARDGIQEAVPFLREIEKAAYIGSSSIIPVLSGDTRLPDGALDPFSYSEFTLRRKSQVALRKLGHAPSEAPGIGFKPVGKYDRESIIQFPQTERRAVSLPKIQAGQTPMEVLQIAGGPDLVHRDRREIAWSYHIDGPDAHTVHVWWKQVVPPVVLKVEEVRPPTWTTESLNN